MQTDHKVKRSKEKKHLWFILCYTMSFRMLVLLLKYRLKWDFQ